MHLLQSSSYIERIFLWQLAIWSSGYLIASQRARPPGSSRLVVALPIAILNFILPLLFDGENDAMSAAIVFMATAGLSNFKLLAWVMNRGPLAEMWLTKTQCAAVYVFTVIPVKEISTEQASGNFLQEAVPAVKRARLLVVKVLSLCVAVPAYALFIDRLPHSMGTTLQGKLRGEKVVFILTFISISLD